MQLNSLDGCVSMSLDVELGCLPSPSQASKTKRRKRSPAYFRRQKRRREEAKKLKATAAGGSPYIIPYLRDPHYSLEIITWFNCCEVVIKMYNILEIPTNY